jgi:thioesterase domain-containing protein
MSIDQFNQRDTAPGKAAVFPCTLLQERLWRLAASNPHGLNGAMRWLVTGQLSHAVAEAALQALVRRHEILRTEFREIGGRPMQVVSSTATLKLRDIDLSFLPAQEGAERAEEIARLEAAEPVDCKAAPLLRASLLRLDSNRSILLLTFHALIADGWSIGMLIREFRATADAIDAGAIVDASEPDLQFADYALWQQELVASHTLDASRAYWQSSLRDATGTRVPGDRSPDISKGERSEITSILVPDTLFRTIEDFARQHNVTLFSLAAASLALMLHRITGDKEIVFGTQVANREEPEAETLVGPTVNAVTLRLTVDQTCTPGDFSVAIAERVREALHHQRLPFEIALGYSRAREARTLHAINLVVHRSYSGIAATEEGQPASFNLLSLRSYPSGAQWDLNFFLIGRDEGWRLSCESDAELYDAATAHGLVEAWQRCLKTLVSTMPGRRLADCDDLDALQPRRRAEPAPLPAPPAFIPLHDPAKQVIRFNEHGTKTPLIVLNNRSVYFQLAQKLGADRPVIDIQLYHPSGPIDLPRLPFEAYGAYALQLIRWAQPRGPYVLGGHCVYGTLAFEVARQLQREGETVDLVVLFDSWAPGYRETMSPRDKKLRLRRLRLYGHTTRLGQFRRGEIGLDDIVRKPILRRLGLLLPDPPPPKVEGQWFDEYLSVAAANYRPGTYGGSDVVLFRSAETLRGRLFDELMGWEPLVRRALRKVELASGHLDMFREKPAGEIVAVLDEVLAARSRP